MTDPAYFCLRNDFCACQECFYDLKDNYLKLIDFVTKISRIESENLRTNLQLRDEARKILEEIGE